MGRELVEQALPRALGVGDDLAVTLLVQDVEDPEVWDSPEGPLLAGATTLGFNWVVQAAEERRCPGPPEFEDLRRLAVSDTDPTGAPDRRFDDCRPGSAFSLYVDTDYRIHGVQVVGPVRPVR